MPWWIGIVTFIGGFMFAALFRASGDSSRYEEAFEYGRQYERALNK